MSNQAEGWIQFDEDRIAQNTYSDLSLFDTPTSNANSLHPTSIFQLNSREGNQRKVNQDPLEEAIQFKNKKKALLIEIEHLKAENESNAVRIAELENEKIELLNGKTTEIDLRKK